MLDKGSLHLFIVAVKSIEKNQEIFLPLDNEDSTNSSPLPSINADLREIKKPLNGLLNGPNSTSATTGEENAPLKKKKGSVPRPVRIGEARALRLVIILAAVWVVGRGPTVSVW